MSASGFFCAVFLNISFEMIKPVLEEMLGIIRCMQPYGFVISFLLTAFFAKTYTPLL